MRSATCKTQYIRGSVWCSLFLKLLSEGGLGQGGVMVIISLNMPRAGIQPRIVYVVELKLGKIIPAFMSGSCNMKAGNPLISMQKTFQFFRAKADE